MEFVFYFYSSPEGYVVMKTALIDQRKERKPQGLQGEGDDKWYEAICDQAGVMIVVCSNDGAIQYFNKAAEEILQYSREEVLYKHTPLIFHSATELKNRAEELSQQGYHIKTGFELLCLYGQLNSQTEWLYVNKAGEQFPVLCTIRRGSGGVGHNDDYIITSVDITSRERQKEELIASLTKEKEQMKANRSLCL